MICNGNDPKQIAFVKELIDGGLERLVTNPKAKMIDMTDMRTFEWLWNKYTKHPWGSQDITKNDIKRFNRGLNIFLNGIGKKQNWIQRNFYLPKRLTGKAPHGEEFISGLGEAASYHQRLMREGSKHVDFMIKDGLYQMFIDKESPLYQKWGRKLTKKELKEFQELEKELWQTPKEVDAERHQELMRRLTEMAGWNVEEGGPNVAYAGEVLKRFNGVLNFEIATGLTVTERRMLNQWNVLRADMMKALINTGITQRRIAETLNNPVERDFIVNSIDKLQKAIDQLLIQGNIDMKQVRTDPTKAGWEESWKNGLDIIDPRTGKTQKYMVENPETGEMVMATGIKKYFPKYVLEITDIMRNVMEFAQSKEKAGYEKLSAEQLEQFIIEDLQPGNITDRLKQAGDDAKYWSLDPVHYLNKYVHDVASANFRAQVNYSYVNGIKELVQAVRDINVRDKTSIEIGDYANEMINTMAQIRDSAVNNYKGSMGEMDNIVRMINGFEYISKLGFSVKSGLKNRTQGFWNWVWYGSRGYSLSSKFYERTDRPYDPTTGEKEVTNSMMLQRSYRRFGMMMGEKGEAANIAAATGGSLDAIVIPKGFTVNDKGALIHASKASNLKRAADGIAWLAELSSKYSIYAPVMKVVSGGAKTGVFSQQWAENQNRMETFRMSFAHAFELENKRYDYWKKKLAKKGKEPTSTEIYDAMENAAGNIAQEMVKMLHFDYDNWAKARILQGKTGKVIGQFQHFKFAFFDLNYRLVRDVVNDIKDFNIIDINPHTGKKHINPNFQRLTRMGMVYSILPGLFGLITDMDIGGLFSTVGWAFGRDDNTRVGGKGGLIDNPIIEEVTKVVDYFGADKGDGSKEYEERVYGTYFGKNPIVSNLGPFVSDLFTVAELFDWHNQTSDEYAHRKNLNYEPSTPEWRYQIARIFNIQGARTAWHSVPAFLRGDMMQFFRIETGMYQPKWITKWRHKNFPKLAETMGYSKEGFFKKDPFAGRKKRAGKGSESIKGSIDKKAIFHSLDQF